MQRSDKTFDVGSLHIRLMNGVTVRGCYRHAIAGYTCVDIYVAAPNGESLAFKTVAFRQVLNNPAVIARMLLEDVARLLKKHWLDQVIVNGDYKNLYKAVPKLMASRRFAEI